MWVPEEAKGVGFPDTSIIGSFEPSVMGARNGAHVLWKSNALLTPDPSFQPLIIVLLIGL